MKIYSGIGSRETPSAILLDMMKIATHLEGIGWMLRSGGANGADTAFANGCANRMIYLPWKGYNGLQLGYQTKVGVSAEAIEIAKKFHPAWDKLTRGGQALHARNAYILLGEKLDSPSDLVICWTPGGKITGGTGQALRMAQAYNVPVINLYDKTIDDVVDFCK